MVKTVRNSLLCLFSGGRELEPLCVVSCPLKERSPLMLLFLSVSGPREWWAEEHTVWGKGAHKLESLQLI